MTVVIAHRGASGYLPEHTLEAKVLAFEMGADYLEQDVVASRDNELLVLHDVHLDRVSDVALRFPDRHRPDGRYYARDFDLEEIRQLQAWERMDADGSAVFPDRYPAKSGDFRFHTLAEELELVASLNRQYGRNAGVYPEIKRPAWHRNEGVDLSRLVLTQLDDLGYRTSADNVFLQCFDAAELRRIRSELGCQLKLVQLLAENSWNESDSDYEYLQTPAGLREIATVAEGIGPWIGHLVSTAEVDGQPVSTGLVSAAHEAGLVVHPYTFRAEQLAPGFESLGEMVSWFVDTLAIDGLFTDFPDRALAAIA